MKTNQERKRFLAKCLPEKLAYESKELLWYRSGTIIKQVLDTELLELCWQVRDKLNGTQQDKYRRALWKVVNRDMDFDLCSGYGVQQLLHAKWDSITDALYEVLKEEV